MAFTDLFRIYPNRNRELRTLAKTAHEFGRTVAMEPSAAQNSGLDSHALTRQRSYCAHMHAMLDALNAKPVPDNPATHPTALPIDLSKPYVSFTESLSGEEVPINETTQLLAESWHVLAVELASSQSASQAGALMEFDYRRAKNNVEALEKLLDEAEARPNLDLPETSLPGSNYGTSGPTSSN